MFVQTNTVRAVRSYVRERLKEQFTESELKAMFRDMVVKRLNLSDSEYLLSDDRLLSESDLLYFRDIVKRLQKNEPFQYIIGTVEFYGLNLKADRRALIPRPETEELVQWVVDTLKGIKTPRILDLCTGSGCIALGVFSAFPHAKIKGVDVSREALQLARENNTSCGFDVEFEILDVLQEDAFSELKEDKYDCWISNPPYIPDRDKAQMQANVLDFEPHLALFVEDVDPLIFYRVIAKNAQGMLKTGGSLFFEIHEGLAEDVVTLLENEGFVNIEVRKDLQGKERMIKAQKP